MHQYKVQMTFWDLRHTFFGFYAQFPIKIVSLKANRLLFQILVILCIINEKCVNRGWRWLGFTSFQLLFKSWYNYKYNMLCSHYSTSAMVIIQSVISFSIKWSRRGLFLIVFKVNHLTHTEREGRHQRLSKRSN